MEVMQENGNTNQLREYHFRGFRLDTSKHSLYGPDGELRPLSSRAIDTLKLLIEHRGQPVSKKFLLESVWPDSFVEENNLNQAISSIRKALGDTKNSSQFIKTLTGKGYSFVSGLEVPEEDEGESIDLPIEKPPHQEPQGYPLLGKKDQFSNSPFGPIALFSALLIVIIGVGAFYIGSNSHPVAETGSAADDPVTTPAISLLAEQGQIIPGSIAVLPFTNLTTSENSDNDLFAIGLHDELINQLSQFNGLRLVSRESVLSPQIRDLPIMEIGGLLRVEHLLTGTIMFEDKQARLKLQVLDPQTGVIQWAFDYDLKTNDLENMIKVQQEIAYSVSEAIQVEVDPVTRSTFLSRSTNSFEAYRYNMASRRAYYNQEFEESLELSNKALALDPDYPGALFNFSKAHYYLSSIPLEGMTTKDHIKRGLESADRLIELAPEKHEGYVLKAVALATSGQWEKSMKQIRHLEEMNVPLWDLQHLVPVLMSLGEYQTTIDILEANLQVEPINGYGRGFLMAAYEVTGNSVQARLEYDIGEELTPDWWGDVVNIFLKLGWNEPFTDPSDLDGASEDVKALISELHDGDRKRIVAYLNEAYFAETVTSSRYVHYAAIAATLEEHELAIKFMTRATDMLSVHFHWVWLPVFQDTWKHPDFRHFLENTGVITYWQNNGLPEICQTTYDFFICNPDYNLN